MTSACPGPAAGPEAAAADDRIVPNEGPYGLIVVGTTMEPGYCPGDTVFIEPDLPVSEGNFAVVWFHDRTGVIKRFVSKTSGTVRLSQYNPARELTYPMAEVKAIHRITGCVYHFEDIDEPDNETRLETVTAD